LAEVHLRDGESLESALKRFKRQVMQGDIIKDIKRHAYYLKPGEKRTKAALARKRAQEASERRRA
jgi:small subunit ribosomal protein S21